MERTYEITGLTLQQMQTLAQACELMARLGLGQWEEMQHHLPLPASQDGVGDAFYAVNDRIRSTMHEELQRVMGLQGGATLGIYSDRASALTKRAWDLHKALRYRLDGDRARDQAAAGVAEDLTGRSVYRRPVEAIGDQPLPVIVRCMVESGLAQGDALDEDVEGRWENPARPRP